MKTRNCFYSLAILFAFFLLSYEAEDTCPSGMRKVYIDDTNTKAYGKARSAFGALTISEYPGSLFLNRAILIEPRFEVHLKVSLNSVNIVENSYERRLYGFTIAICKDNTNKISGITSRTHQSSQYNTVYSDQGYNNFRKCLITEFDFFKDSADPDPNSYSIRYCDNECSSQDNAKMVLVKGKLNSQRYNEASSNNWDFRLVYKDSRIYLYSQNSLITSYYLSLYNKFSNRIAYVGFTGFLEGNNRELSIIGTFVCEDNYEISKMQGYFLYGSSGYSERTYSPGETINYMFNFVNNQGQWVYHTYGYNIWSYQFSLVSDCGQYTTTMTSYSYYYLKLTTKACTSAGRHSIYLSNKKGKGQYRYYNVVAGALSKITLAGYNGKITSVPTKRVSNVLFLNFGNSPKKDFIKTNSVKIQLDFYYYDSYNNAITSDSNPKRYFQFKKVSDSGSLSSISSSALSFTVTRKDSHYLMEITVNQLGTYQLDKHQYMTEAIRFTVVPGEVSPSKSYCTINYSSSPILLTGSTIYHYCYFKDDYGNEVTPALFEQNSIYEFYSEVKKVSPTTAYYSTSRTKYSSYYMSQYKTAVTGKLEINGYFKKKGTSSYLRITPKIYQFTVKGSPSTYIISKVYNLQTKQWINVDNSAINYQYDSSGLITAVDFAESDGLILISSYGNYPNDFYPSNLKPVLINTHDTNYKMGDLEARMITLNNKKYVGIYTKNRGNSDTVVKRTSHYYRLTLTYKVGSRTHEKTITLKYSINIGSYTTCIHDIAPSKTYINMDSSIKFLSGDTEKKLARIELRTTDNYLYNYNIASQIQITLDRSSSYLHFRVAPLSVDGTYDIYGKSSVDYNGNLNVKVKGQTIKTVPIKSLVESCRLTIVTGSFKHVKTSGKQYYYQYTGSYPNGVFSFEFVLHDKIGRIHNRNDYWTEFDDITSSQYGKDKSKYSITYKVYNSGYRYRYQFQDKIGYENRQLTFEFLTRDPSCYNKYYITFDGLKGGAPVDLSKSNYGLLNTKMNINQYAYVDVIYKDVVGLMLGLQSGRINDIKKNTVVKGKRTSDNKEITFSFDSITKSYALRYKYYFNIAGVFKITATSSSTSLKCSTSDSIEVIDNVYSLKNSKLQVILNTIIDMKTNVRASVDNMSQSPVYKLYFYSATGVKTTTDCTFTCTLTGTRVNMNLDVAKKSDHVQFTIKNENLEYFKSLVKGNYNLVIKDNKSAQITYPLLLKGDGTTDASNDPSYYLSYTQFNPWSFSTTAGKEYTITLEFRASDNLRWNYLVDTSKFTFSNTQNLNSNDLSIKVLQGYKKGQVRLVITQKKVTSSLNKVYAYYKGSKIPTYIAITVTHAALNKLVLKSGPTTGNVINLPTISFQPLDVYGNIYTSLFTTSQTQKYLDSLTVGKSLDGASLTSSNYLDKTNKYLIVRYKSTKTTNVRVTSSYFSGYYDYRIKSGPIYRANSWAEVIDPGTKGIVAQYTIRFYPRDQYNNYVDELTKAEMDKFHPYCYSLSSTWYKTCQLKKKSASDTAYTVADCTITFNKIGNFYFSTYYDWYYVACKNCQVKVTSSTPYLANTKIYYTNRKIYLSTTSTNEIQGKKNPQFELTFYDQYNNQMDAATVQKMYIIVTLEGTDVKLCITNSGNKKIMSLCPVTNGDDNINKFQYLVNGDNYKLIIEEQGKSTKMTYNLKITGGYTDGSSAATDFTKTVFSPEKIELQAGSTGNVVMELRAVDNKRKNYWYPTQKVKVNFAQDSNTCSYAVYTADLPGKYNIRITCTKSTTTNSFSVTVDNTKIAKTVGVTIVSAPAYYLEVENSNTFTVSGDRYTLKTNPTSDDVFSFQFKLKDRYQNYIITDVTSKNQLTIGSETYGNKYYSIQFDSSKKNYLFTDKINAFLSRHIWNIVCKASGRKYSFIYSKIAGKPDAARTSWTIDKTDYIIEAESTVKVTLLDKYGINLSTVNGKLDSEKSSIIVEVSNGQRYTFDSISQNMLVFKYKFTKIGSFDITVKYKGEIVKNPAKRSIKVSYHKVDIKKSKLYYDLGDHIQLKMYTTENTNIKNKDDYPSYIFFFYTPDGNNATHADPNIAVSCKMTYGSSSWQLKVDKKDTYIKLVYTDGFKDTFKRLPLGLYYINIIVGSEYINYPIYLLGEKNVSPQVNYDLSKTFIKPYHIDGVAGKQYEIDVEFRAKDNLRWNYDIVLDSITYTNTYNLNNNDLIIVKKKGEKNGQMKLLITQKISTYGRDYNMIYLYYKNEKIKTYISLKLKCASFKTLEYVSGVADGTVLNPPVIKYIPKDVYGNLFTDLFDSKKYPKSELNKLTSGVSIDNYPVTTNNYVSDEKYLNVQYGCTKVTTIKVTSKYNSKTYQYKLLSGPIYAKTSKALIKKTTGVVAGDTTTIEIYPKDINGNNVTSINTTDLSKIEVEYEVNRDNKTDISNNCVIVKGGKTTDFFRCQGNVIISGDIEFDIEYDNIDISCTGCKFNIVPNKIDFTKTKVYYKNENEEMLKTSQNKISVVTNPVFEIHFFDQYNNKITSASEVKSLQLSSTFTDTDIKLCVSDNNAYKQVSVCPTSGVDENGEKWRYLTNGKNYKLSVYNTRNRMEFPVQIIGGYTEGTSAPISASNTYFNPTSLNLIAGEEKVVLLELRNSENLRKNYWFKEPYKHITISTNNKCTYSLHKSDKPGQYSLGFTCTEKKGPFNVVVNVDNSAAKQQIALNVDATSPEKSKLYNMNGKEITQANLGSVSVEGKFQMKTKLYDKYDNLITNINFDLSTLLIKMEPTKTVTSHQWSAVPVADVSGDIIITLESTYAGEHSVEGKYFPLKKYNIKFTPGKPDAENSLLEVSHNERIAGEKAFIYITPYDKYNNYIDAEEYKTKNPYVANYTNEGSSNRQLLNTFSVETREEKKVFSYPGTFYVRGIATIYAYIGTTQIKCVTCRININSKDVHFKNSEIMKYELEKNQFEVMKNGISDNNTKEEAVFRIYPKDEYGNIVDIIPENLIKTYKVYIKSQNESTTYYLKLNNNQTINESYAEFIVNDIEGAQVTYKTLVGGFYDVFFTDGKDTLKYNMSLTGDGNGGSNEPADIQHTAILEQKLKYEAGEKGYMIIEVRTKSDLRKNFWEGFNIKVESCDKNDRTFNYLQERAGLMGVFLITVSTEKANTYPSLKKCPLKIYVNNELVKKLSPQQEVSPNEVVRSEIVRKYLKEGKTDVLKDGNTDKNYEFEVASYDQYNNFAETKQEILELNVKKEGEEDKLNGTSSENDLSSGYRKYSIPVTIIGTYIIGTEKSGPQGLYLNESTFKMNPGSIDVTKTLVKEKDTPIKAGEKAGVNIEIFDKYGNELYYDEYMNKFTVTFIDQNGKTHKSKGDYDSNNTLLYFISETPITVMGNTKVEVNYNNQDPIDASNTTIEVIPDEPYGENSLLLMETSEGIFTKYKAGDSLEAKNDKLLAFNITLYDKYNNPISEIPANTEILEPTLSGNYMEPISFTVNPNNDYFNLDFDESAKYVHIYQHLVGGTYDFNYIVNTTTRKVSVKYNVVIKGGDGLHGNGPYVLEKCNLVKVKDSFTAGTYGEFNLELRNAQGLLYNDDLNLADDISVETGTQDNTFSYTIEKEDPDKYGIYKIKIYSEKKGENNINILLAPVNSADHSKKKISSVSYTVIPEKTPEKEFTKIINGPDSSVSIDSIIEITFTLADKYNNIFDGRNDIIEKKYFTLLNNEEPISYASLSLLADKSTFKILVYPKYPPRTMSINILYNDGENTVYCFQNNIEVSILTGIDYSLTQIISTNNEEIKAGEILDMWLYIYDEKGECLDDQDYSSRYSIEVTGPLDSTVKQFTQTYSVKNVHVNESICNNVYQIITTDENKYKYAGNYLIKVMANGNLISKFNQYCSNLGYSLDGFKLEQTFDTEKVVASETISFTITGTDMFGNKVSEPLFDDIDIYFKNNEIKSDIESRKTEDNPGELKYEVSIHKAGNHQLHITYKGQEITNLKGGENLPIAKIINGRCSADNNEHIDTSHLKEDFRINDKNHFLIQCYDKDNNKITQGGEEFIIKVQRDQDGVLIDIESEIVDNNDGSYTANFIPDREGDYIFNLMVRDEKYGDEIRITLKNKVCEDPTPYQCPNNNKKCVAKLIECIEGYENCKNDETKPFWCKVDGEFKCTKSQVDCDCPQGYKKCSIQNYCVPEDRKDMCSVVKRNDNFCKMNFGAEYTMYKDGYCRKNNYRMPNQRVCPIGKVLCADLTCRNNYTECVKTEERKGNQIRCVGQQIMSDIAICPSTVTCSKETDVVCPNGMCVENEIYCEELPNVCHDENRPYHCQDDTCAKDYNYCANGIACGHKLSLCEDKVCRETC